MHFNLRWEETAGVTDRGEKRQVRPLHGLGGSGTGETDQGEREADEAQGMPRGSGAKRRQARTTIETLKRRTRCRVGGLGYRCRH